MGRFTSKDVERGLAGSPRTHHRFAYALNSPTGFVDPTGRDAVSVAALIFGSLILIAGLLCFATGAVAGLRDCGIAIGLLMAETSPLWSVAVTFVLFAVAVSQALDLLDSGEIGEEGVWLILFWLAFAGGLLLAVEALSIWAGLSNISRGFVLIIMINLLNLQIRAVIERAKEIEAARKQGQGVT